MFDLDGVPTRTAELHAAAWTESPDAFLLKWAGGRGSQAPFDAGADYEA